MAEVDDLAGILSAAGRGDQTAIGRLYALLYEELHEQAHRAPGTRKNPPDVERRPQLNYPSTFYDSDRSEVTAHRQ